MIQIQENLSMNVKCNIFSSYLQDLPTGSFGKTSSQTLFPSIDHKRYVSTEIEKPMYK